jgi:hypothetical protein
MKVEVPKDFRPAQQMRDRKVLPSAGLLEAALGKEHLRQTVAKTVPERSRPQVSPPLNSRIASESSD